jgi:predicted amidophosphoribosyltransferase
MAAFCGCCGAEITLKAEACPVCGTPRHGMFSSNPSLDTPPEASAHHAHQQLFACESRKEIRRLRDIPG